MIKAKEWYKLELSLQVLTDIDEGEFLDKFHEALEKTISMTITDLQMAREEYAAQR